MKILVIYDSVYGNTVQIARAIGGAIAGNVKVLHAGEASPLELEGVDLLIIGAPTQGGRPTAAIQDFLKTVPMSVIRDIKIATFDTRVTAKWVGIFGYAAGRIAKALQKKGGVLVAKPEPFFVEGTEGPLKEGEVERAAAWAQDLLINLK